MIGNKAEPWRAAQWATAGVGLVLALVTLPGAGVRFAGGVLLGAALSALNLWLIARSVRAVLSGGPTGRHTAAIIVKFSVVVVGLYLISDSRLVQGLPLLVGLAALPVGIVVSQLSSTRSLREG